MTKLPTPDAIVGNVKILARKILSYHCLDVLSLHQPQPLLVASTATRCGDLDLYFLRTKYNQTSPMPQIVQESVSALICTKEKK